MEQPIITQICVVVEDVEAANRHWATVLGRQEETVITIFPPDMVLHYTDGQLMDYLDCRVAKYDMGNIVLELIQPGASMSPWRKFLEEKGQGVFHFCLKVDDRSAFQQRLTDIGAGLPYHIGYFEGGSYSYADTKRSLGLELSINNHQDNRALMERLKSGEVRALDELKI